MTMLLPFIFGRSSPSDAIKMTAEEVAEADAIDKRRRDMLTALPDFQPN